MEEEVKLSPPWIQYVKSLCALFGNDPEIEVDYDESDNVLTMRVANEIKADAIAKLLPAEKTFGNDVLTIRVIPANGSETPAMVYRNAFAGNPAFAFVHPVEGVFANPITYVVFRRRIVQYFNDNLGDIHGNRTTLCEQIAREVFENQDDIYYCTDNEGEDIGKPLGEWP